MKLVSREALMALPPGTIYSEAQPCTFNTWLVKGETIAHEGKNIDWFHEASVGACFSVHWDKLEVGEESDIDFLRGGRDGCFDDEQLYAVLDDNDVAAWIGALLRALRTKKASSAPLPKDADYWKTHTPPAFKSREWCFDPATPAPWHKK